MIVLKNKRNKDRLIFLNRSFNVAYVFHPLETALFSFNTLQLDHPLIDQYLFCEISKTQTQINLDDCFDYFGL